MYSAILSENEGELFYKIILDTSISDAKRTGLMYSVVCAEKKIMYFYKTLIREAVFGKENRTARMTEEEMTVLKARTLEAVEIINMLCEEYGVKKLSEKNNLTTKELYILSRDITIEVRLKQIERLKMEEFDTAVEEYIKNS